jgi:hypothetical protein
MDLVQLSVKMPKRSWLPVAPVDRVCCRVSGECLDSLTHNVFPEQEHHGYSLRYLPKLALFV